MIKLTEIIEKIKPQEVVGSIEKGISELIIANNNNKNENALMWVSPKKVNLLQAINTGVIICAYLPEKNSENCTYLVVDNPRWAFLSVLHTFFMATEREGIAETAVIDDSVQLGEHIFIGENVVIEKDCVIKNGSRIGHNTVVKNGTVIGNNCKIGSCCVIGSIGFGYEKGPSGEYMLIPHIGNVVLEDNVEIGNNTAIDRAVLGSTLLKKNVKVDNLVHIAHGVEIGENSLVIANAMVAGSVKIGKNVWVAPSSSIINGKSVSDNAVIGLGAVVIKNVDAEQVIVGNPGKPLQKK